MDLKQNNENNNNNIMIFDLKCKIHNDEVVNICVFESCGNRNYSCNLCKNKDLDNCISNNHTIISVSFNNLTKYFYNSMLIDYKKLQLMYIDTKNEDLDKIDNNIKNLKKEAKTNIANRINKLKQKFNEKINSFRNEIDKSARLINEAKNNICSSDSSSENLNNFLASKPETLCIIYIKDLFEQALKDNTLNKKSFISKVENIVSLIKKYLDKDKMPSIYKEMKTLVYYQYICDKNSIIEKTINSKLTYLNDILSNELCNLRQGKLFSSAKDYHNLIKNNIFTSNPSLLTNESIICQNCQKNYTIDSIFTCFNTLKENNSYVAYASLSYSVDIYDLNLSKIVQVLKFHTQHVFIVRHFVEEQNSNDYLLSTGYDKILVVWAYNNANDLFKIAVSINTGHIGLYLYSALLIFDSTNLVSDFKPSSTNSKMSFLPSNAVIISSVPNEQIKVFDYKGNLIKHIGNKTDYTYYINHYFDEVKNSYYIINANSKDVKSICLSTGLAVKTFKDTDTIWHMSALVKKHDNLNILFETDGYGVLRLWNYDKCSIYKKISVKNCNLRGFIVWNETYVIAASSDKSFKIINLKSEKIESSKVSHNNILCTVQKLDHPYYGEVLFTCSIDTKLKMWTV